MLQQDNAALTALKQIVSHYFIFFYVTLAVTYGAYKHIHIRTLYLSRNHSLVSCQVPLITRGSILDTDFLVSLIVIGSSNNLLFAYCVLIISSVSKISFVCVVSLIKRRSMESFLHAFIPCVSETFKPNP